MIDLHTAETLAEFWTDVAKAGGLEYRPNVNPVTTWGKKPIGGPYVGSPIDMWRPRPEPLEFFIIKFPRSNERFSYFTTLEAAEICRTEMFSHIKNTTIIRVVEDRPWSDAWCPV